MRLACFAALLPLVSTWWTTEDVPMPKVYIYTIPETLLHRDYHMDYSSCHHYFYAIELALPTLLTASRFVQTASTLHDAAQADYFLVPQYSTCYYHRCKVDHDPEVCRGKTAEYLTAILDHVEEEYPFWQRKQGRDHLFVFSWDWGVHVLGEKDESVARNRVASSIHLTLLGMAHKDHRQVFDPHKDISIPPLGEYRHVETLPRPAQRTIFAYFRGSITNEYEYSLGIRQRLLKYGKEDPAHYFIRTEHSAFYWHELINARYALCPLGWSHWSPRLFDAIEAGAIPVIIADEWDVAFNRTIVDFREFTVRVPQRDIGRLTEILKAIPQAEEERMRSRMKKVAHRFAYHPVPQKDDATESLMQILAKRPLPQVENIVLDLGNASDGEYTHSGEEHDEEDEDSLNDEL
ncbi:Glycosyltransferase family 47 protein [Paramicrosporidium saccamoebae]|uniref:Glycosyltransferase family 47 protein n=1 Tax=Paramicrosporidium saccamoebae TaxID=1246581 RepID=A0A2H9TQU8_9FUNG|nr:Glycosyltransferase family 47 protein [Paramicrosporidium saccamoebae]